MNTSQLKKAMALIRENLNAEVPISQVEIFLFVAENEGINEDEIAEKIKMSRPTAKRNLKRLTDLVKGSAHIGGGHVLCDINEDGSVVLTEKGKKLLKDLSMVS